MRISMQRRHSRFLGILAVLALALRVGAIDVNSLQPQGYLSDFSHVVDAQSKQQIENYCSRVEQSLGVQMALVTIDSLDNRDIETVANQLFRHFGVGSKQGNQGVMLLLAVKDRKSRIEVGYGIEPYLTDGFSGSILRTMRPELQAGNYGPALLTAAHAMAAQIAQGKGLPAPEGTIITPEPRRAAPRQRSIPLPLILFGIFFLIWLLSRGGRSGRGGRGGGGGFLTGMLMGSLMNSGRSRDWGGGGFGGWNSGGGGGGGFGGFGGGSSGGGGASSDW